MSEKNIAVIGSRGFSDINLLNRTLSKFKIKRIISGGARGADSLARQYAIAKKIDYVEYLPDWKTLGRSAGVVRNKLIVNDADIVIAFWDGESMGTKFSIEYGIKLGKDVVVINYKELENEK